MLPNFLVIGAAKCGTSSICTLLGRHPEVFMSRPKEIHFFGRNDPAKTFAWYETFFEGAGTSKAVGEGSTSYTHPDIIRACASEIAVHIPECRLIYMVRHPLERLESDWKMRVHEGWSASSINTAVDKQSTLITHGLYWTNLSVYRERFGDDQILVVFLEDFARDPDRELERCLHHIGVDPAIRIDHASEPRNAASGYRNYSGLASWLRRAPVMQSVKRRLPKWGREVAKSLLSKKVRVEVEWEPAVRARVLASFTEDARELLRYCGKDSSFWSSVSERPTSAAS